MRKRATILCLTCLVVMAVYFAWKLRSSDSIDHSQFQTHLWRLNQLNAAFNQEILTAKFNGFHNYDRSHQLQIEAARTFEPLNHLPTCVDAQHENIERQLAAYSTLLRQRHEWFEHFKSQNAGLANSRRYLPVGIEELSARLEGGETNRELARLVHDLAQLVLLRLSGPGEELATEERLQRVENWSLQRPDHAESRFLASLVEHARIIAAAHARIETITRQLLDLPSAQILDQLQRAYDGEVSLALRQARQSRGFLYLLSILLLAGLGYILRSARTTNRLLELRVARRTSDLQAEIAERASTESQLKDSLRSLASINAVLDKSCIIERTDSKGALQYVNDNFCRISEFKRQELLHQDYRFLRSDEHSTEFFNALWKTITRGEIWRGEIKSRAKSGRTYWTDTTIGPLLDPNNKPNGYMAIRIDISERKRAEAEVAEVNRRLIETSRLAGMSEVATDILHNIGNVLNSVNVSFTCLAESIGSIQKHIDHIKDIVAMHQSFATVSGIPQPVQLSTLVEDALELIQSTSKRNDIEIIKEFQTLPSIVTERHKVLQILVNLIRNAREAGDATGRPDKKLVLRLIDHHGNPRIAISDNGVGIPVDHLTRVFNHGFTTKIGGHGFGLHSAALAAHELGGSLSVSSDGLGRGATFTLDLPLQRAAQAA